MTTLLTVSLVSAFAILIALAMVFGHLAQHRVDVSGSELPAGGASRFWQINVGNPKNYSKTGRRLLVWFYLLLALWLAALVNLLAQWMR